MYSSLTLSLLSASLSFLLFLFFFFNDPATTEIYTLSLHDALPISLDGNGAELALRFQGHPEVREDLRHRVRVAEDRKSTRLNSSHVSISYAVFCLKKKKKKNKNSTISEADDKRYARNQRDDAPERH